MTAFRALFVKDLRLLARRRGGFLSTFAVGAIIMLMASLAGEASPESLARRGASAFWMGLFLGSTLLLSDSFESEHRDGAQRALILLGASPTAFFYAKALVNFVGLLAAGLLLTPVAVALFGLAPAPLGGLGVLILGTLSLSAPGTLFTALVSESDKRNLLLPIMMFPLVMPVLVTVVQSTVLLTFGDPMGQTAAWMALLGVFALLHWLLDGALYGKAVD
ncbi:MAG: heme exporter protein CcmB [Vicinamibacteria bacterium]